MTLHVNNLKYITTFHSTLIHTLGQLGQLGQLIAGLLIRPGTDFREGLASSPDRLRVLPSLCDLDDWLDGEGATL